MNTPSDNELLNAAALAGLDGPELATTKKIACKLRATSIDVNRWWLVTPADWCCPGCGRSKSSFARLNSKGAMMGHIVRHHDHMTDVVEDAFHQTSGTRDQVVADELSEAFVKRMAEAVSAYNPILVCVDCNNADARAKRDAPTDKRFSFSAQDIKRFVIAHPNKDHDIIIDVARDLWNNYRRTFHVRMDLIERIAEIGAAAEDWYQGHTHHTADPVMVEKSAGAQLARQLGLPSGTELLERVICLQTPRRQQNIDLSKWRRTSPKPNKKPTQGEIDHAARVTHTGHWRAVPDDWICPACNRVKVETLRQSSNFLWAFEIYESMVFDPLTGKSTRARICGDCKNTRISLAKEAVIASELISVRDLHAIVKPQPHQRHVIDNGVIEQIIESLQRRSAERTGRNWDRKPR